MKSGLLSAAILFLASSAIAQHAHQSDMPRETGQSQFAAIAEIVGLLSNDPETDWSQVDVKALRDHLVDMDNVTTKASVKRLLDGQSVTFLVTGEDAVALSIRRMVVAHSAMLQRSVDWTIIAKEREDGAAMIVRVSSQDEMDQVLGLGFFGLMTVGAHHQQHHLMIATRRSPH